MGDQPSLSSISSAPEARQPAESAQFLAPIVIQPTAPSTTPSITIIFLHGRGQTAQYFHGPLLSTLLPDSSITFRKAIPQAKFVFPTALIMRATKYRRSLIHQWYDGSGDWEPEALGNMRDSVEYIHRLIRDEVRLLGSDAGRVVLAGFSQGCAMAVTSLLLWEGEPLGAVVGMSGFVPLNSHMSALLDEGGDSPDESDDGIVFGSESGDDADHDSGLDDQGRLKNAIQALREEAELPRVVHTSPLSFLQTAVFLGHGTEDPEVPYQHGKLNAELLEKMGIDVEFRTYEGLDHCYSPEMLGHAVSFLRSTLNLSDIAGK